MDVVIGAMKHESNTFTTLRTELEEFDPVEGGAVFDSPRWAEGSATAGIVDALDEGGIDVTPTLFGSSIPSGMVEADAFERMKSAIVDGVREADPDGVCLDLHGSMYADGESDPEGDLLTSVREVVGDEIPVVCSLDMHATLTDRMVEAADGFTAYRTAPHTDVYDTGFRAGELLRTILERDQSTTVEWIRLPMLLAGEQSETDEPPMCDLIATLEEADETPGVLSTSYLLGFPWADSPHNGVYALGVGEADAAADLRSTVERLATEFWDRHRDFDFTTEAYPLDEALDVALAEPSSPVVISDSGDNPTAGATEDLTIVLERVLERSVADALVAVIADAESYEACETAGEGAEVSLALGRTGPDPDADPLSIDARVVTVDAVDGINAAVVEVADVTVVVTDQRTSVYDPTFLERLGVDPREFAIVIVKSGYLSPAYQSLAGREVLALTPGDTNEILDELPYESVPRPIYPLDTDVDWSVD